MEVRPRTARMAASAVWVRFVLANASSGHLIPN